MRDPAAALNFEQDTVSRHLYHPLKAEHFLHGAGAHQLMSDRKLVEFKFDGEKKIISPKIPFVTYPYEWTDAQLRDAAALTLDVGDEALKYRHELKDASAWNIVFSGCRPLFCDHLSFQEISGARWWAFGQYIRHFVFPLSLSRYRALEARYAFQLSRDGLSPEQMRGLFGMRRFATRYWPLMLQSSPREAARPEKADGQSYHQNLYALSRWLLKGARPQRNRQSAWSGYVNERPHYADAAANLKRETLKTWLERCRPGWVIDLGCNTGEFSILAKDAGAQVIALDLDHDSVQNLYLAHPDDETLFPLVANLDDIAGGRGWGGGEFPGLAERLAARGDMTLMLALIHHLAISNALPYAKIAEFAHAVTKRYLIVEFLEETDPLVVSLCAQRRRSPDEFSLERQKNAFLTHFTALQELRLPDTARHLVLMEKR